MSERSAVLTATSRGCAVVFIAARARKYVERYRQREERHRARRATPETREARQRSRTAYCAPACAEALALAGQKHPQLIETRVCAPRASALS